MAEPASPNTPATAGIAFIIREKFGWTLPSLRRIYAYTEVPFRLYVVDSMYPPEIRAAIVAELRGRNNVVWIRCRRFLYPNEALNEVIARLAEPYLCLVQNDVLVEPGYLRFMLETCEQLGCDLVSPLIDEYEGESRKLHRGTDCSGLGIVERAGRLEVNVPRTVEQRDGRKRLYHLELHCLMMTAAAARAFHAMPRLNTREHYELAIRAWRRGQHAYLDERAHVAYVLPPIRAYDRAYFRFRWDRIQALASHCYVRDRWRVENLPNVMEFIETMNEYLQQERVITDHAELFEIDRYPHAPAP